MLDVTGQHKTNRSRSLSHQSMCQIILFLCWNLLSYVIGLELKGFGQEGKNIELISKIIEKNLRIQCNVLMGANLANEVAEDKFCETTIGKYSIFFPNVTIN